MLDRILGPAGPSPQFQPTWGPWAGVAWTVAISVFSIAVALGLGSLGLFATELPDGSLNYHALDAVGAPLQVACIMLVASRLRLNPFDVLALRRPTRVLRFIAVALGILLALLVILTIIAAFADEDMWDDPSQKANEQTIRRTGFFESLLMEGLVGPIKEEVTFRGFLLLSFFGSRLWFWGGAVISSLLFAFIHNPTSVNVLFHIPYFLLGLGFALGLRYTGSLWVPIGMHIVKNAIAVASLSL